MRQFFTKFEKHYFGPILCNFGLKLQEKDLKKTLFKSGDTINEIQIFRAFLPAVPRKTPDKRTKKETEKLRNRQTNKRTKGQTSGMCLI